MDVWVIWLIATVVLAVGEIATTTFFLGPFAVGAALATLAALVGAPDAVAWGVFAATTAATFAFVRPVARRHLYQGPSERTGTAALIGRGAIVTSRVGPHEIAGTIKLEGETWTARPYEEDRTYEPDAHVQVIEIRGATAFVDDI